VFWWAGAFCKEAYSDFFSPLQSPQQHLTAMAASKKIWVSHMYELGTVPMIPWVIPATFKPTPTSKCYSEPAELLNPARMIRTIDVFFIPRSSLLTV